MKTYHIGVEAAMEVLKGKWKPLILCHIGAGINRNGQLLKAIPGLSQKVLTEQLHQLVEDGILEKKIISESPLHIEYHYTNYGKDLKVILLSLCQWGEGHISFLKENGKNVELEPVHFE